jgi:4-hydroxy-tetrahydrodipicolinate reductase
MRALVVGPGKMGHAIESVLAERGHSVAGRIGRGEKLERFAPDEVDIAFEFTAASAAPMFVTLLLTAGIPVVSGTTGWDVEAARALSREREVPFLHAPNFSIGDAAVRRALMELSRVLAPFPEFEPGILERHHSAKKDAPSGTALALEAAIQQGRGPGNPALRVPIVSLRQGGHPGEHIVFFEGADESVEIVHRARSRSLFAVGAVSAAEWLLASGRSGPVSFDDFLQRGSS